MSSLETWAVVLSPIIVAVVGVIGGQRYAARRAAQVEDRKVDMSAYRDQADGWRRDVEELRKDRDEDRRAHDAEIARLRRRIDQLEADREQDRERIRRLSADLLKMTDWGRALTRLLEHANIEFPPSPIDLSATDPRLRLPRSPGRPETD